VNLSYSCEFKLFSTIGGKFYIPKKYRHIKLRMHGSYPQKIDIFEIVWITYEFFLIFFFDTNESLYKFTAKNNNKHRISNSCTWPSALLGRLFPSWNWPLWKFYPLKFPATLVLKTMTARRSPLYFRTVGGQENHVQGALPIGIGVVRE
jgi:hypothetical protein